MSSGLIMRTLLDLCPRPHEAENTTAKSSASWLRTFTCPRAQLHAVHLSMSIKLKVPIASQSIIAIQLTDWLQ